MMTIMNVRDSFTGKTHANEEKRTEHQFVNAVERNLPLIVQEQNTVRQRASKKHIEAENDVAKMTTRGNRNENGGGGFRHMQQA